MAKPRSTSSSMNLREWVWYTGWINLVRFMVNYLLLPPLRLYWYYLACQSLSLIIFKAIVLKCQNEKIIFLGPNPSRWKREFISRNGNSKVHLSLCIYNRILRMDFSNMLLICCKHLYNTSYLLYWKGEKDEQK